MATRLRIWCPSCSFADNNQRNLLHDRWLCGGISVASGKTNGNRLQLSQISSFLWTICVCGECFYVDTFCRNVLWTTSVDWGERFNQSEAPPWHANKRGKWLENYRGTLIIFVVIWWVVDNFRPAHYPADYVVISDEDSHPVVIQLKAARPLMRNEI